jgi:hypothetical protein
MLEINFNGAKILVFFFFFLSENLPNFINNKSEA